MMEVYIAVILITMAYEVTHTISHLHLILMAPLFSKVVVLLSSLWFGNSKPSMGTFLKPFRKTMKQLQTGIQCESPEKGKFICRAIMLCGTADLPARSLLCNYIQYNGAYACWKCEQVGRTEASGKGHARIFPFIKDDPKVPARTPANVFANAKVAVETHFVVKEIKGPSWLQFFSSISHNQWHSY